MQKFAHWLVTAILRYRILILATIIGVTLFFGYHLTTITVDNDSTKAIPDTLTQNVQYTAIKEQFNSKYNIIFTSVFPDSLSLRQKLEHVKEWSNHFETIEIDGIAAVDQVSSLGTLKVPAKGGMFGLRTVSIVGDESTDEEIRSRITENSALTKAMISADESTFLILIYTNEEAARHKTIKAVVDYTEELRTKGFKTSYVTGATVTSWYLNRDMKKDFAVLLPFSVLITVIVLFLIFRKISYVVAPLIVMVITVVWIFGLMAFLKIPLNVLTTIIPIILFPIGVANSIYVIKTYMHWRIKDADYAQSFTHSYAELLNPIFLTSITTFIGFSSFIFSTISWTRYFGFFTGLGVMLALGLTIILLPIFLRRDALVVIEEKEHHLVPSAFFEFLIFKSPWAKLILLGAILFSVLLLIPDSVAWKKGLKIPSLHFESNPISFFNNSHDMKVSDKLINKQFGGTSFYDIMITSPTPFTDSASWENVGDAVSWIESQHEVGSVFSLYSIISRVSELSSNRPLSETGVKLMVGEKSLLAKKGAKLLTATISPDKKSIRLALMCQNIEGFNYLTFADKIEKHLTKTNPHWKVVSGGQVLLLDAMVMLLINTQVVSLASTFLLVALVLVLLFRSLRLGLYTTIPILVTSLFIAALMALFGITINTVTIIIINSSVGMGIDYAIHFTAGYLHIGKEGGTNKEVLMKTLTQKGNVILFNTVAVGVGFLTLCFSSFPPVRHLGLFIFLSMFVSTLFTLLFLPLFLNLRHGKHLD